MLEEMQNKGRLIYCWWEFKLIQPPWKCLDNSQKLKVKLPHIPDLWVAKLPFWLNNSLLQHGSQGV